MNDFKEIRNNLINMLGNLDEQLGDIGNDVNLLDEPAINAFDCFENTSIQEIKKIKQAISGIDSGTYGICLTCGKSIKKQRLNKNSFSSLCIHCTEKKNDN